MSAKLNKLTTLALDFLADRNPLDEYWSRIQYVHQLHSYIISQGEEALQALAGFYIYCINKGNSSEAIATTFAHDLGQQNDKWMLPRSSSYKEFWVKECEERGWINARG